MTQYPAGQRMIRGAFAAFCVLTLYQSVWSQEPVEEGPTPNAAAQLPGEIEELTVVAPRLLEAMRQELVIAEDDVLNSYNALNDDDLYDINCRDERPTGTYIPVRICRAEFVNQETARTAYDFLSGLDYVDPNAELRYHENIMRQKMAQLAAENPVLYNALLRYYNLKTNYDQERARRFENQFFAR